MERDKQLTLTSNKIGNYEGAFDYEFWKDKPGKGKMIISQNGAFSCSWNEINNILFRTGKKFKKPYKNWKEYSKITLSYNCLSYEPNGNSYLAVYGWLTEPLVEYYIVDNWGSWRPSGKNIPKGSVTIDGEMYEIYVTTRKEQPSILGKQTFQQYWSINKNKRKIINNLNKVSVSIHFKAWEKYGLKIGNLYETSLVVEGYKSNGDANISSVTVTTNF